MALLAIPFFILVLAVFELMLMVVVAGALDEATGGAARDARFAASEPSSDALATAICAAMPAIGGDCAPKVAVELERLTPSPG